jgi:2-keto-4-pentenoate hydratase
VSTTLNKAQIEKVSQQLLRAEETRQPIAPLTETFTGLNISDAYRIQMAVSAAKQSRGVRVIGKKAGITSKAIQQLFGVKEPDYGQLFDYMCVSDGGFIPCSALIQPKIEPEIAFVLAEDLRGPGVNVADVLGATKYVVPILEVIDSRIADWKIKLEDTVADNASCGKVVIGGCINRVEGLDLRLTGVVLEKNGEIVATGAGAAALGNPANAVAWLANKLAEFDEGLRANDLVLPGALTTAINVGPGDSIRATFDRLGAVSVKFE